MALSVVPSEAGKANKRTLANAVLHLKTDKNGTGTGFHVGNGIIFTAEHVLGNGKTFNAVDSIGLKHSMKILWRSKNYDVALMKVSGFKSLKRLELDCAKSSVADDVVAKGYPYDLGYIESPGKVMSGVAKRGVRWAEGVFVSSPVLPGMSGGPAISAKTGKVAGLLVSFKGYTRGPFFSWSAFSVMVPSVTLCKLLGRT